MRACVETNTTNSAISSVCSIMLWIFFCLGPDAAFNEGRVSMRSYYCPVQHYNKDKPDKYRVDVFILADAKYDVIYHLDVYQGKNEANVDIDNLLHSLTTT